MSEFVCKDDDGDWYFFAEERKYKRIKGAEVRSSVTGKHLPDPDFILRQRKKAYPQALEQDIRPTEATYKLWEHWNAAR